MIEGMAFRTALEEDHDNIVRGGDRLNGHGGSPEHSMAAPFCARHHLFALRKPHCFRCALRACLDQASRMPMSSPPTVAALVQVVEAPISA
jgi:hypothetical protein